ncbi:Tautomerase/MIF superfamily [Propionibacterium ruminifibrarum]|uniref:Tautomerase/MIF superfamily n=1 Tax=Propionibacterium ruminifibrarum TaxID=1962131 RepID=A0A375I5L7_9ACTN|nr:hypothetical protein [Propionibacterium ruminifibrarum]SPF69122.1 Tautomerase/MIF superfamily [Propionibacterium ruminifibrarum]
MPFVIVRTNAELTWAQESELAASMGRAMSHVPGKSEADLLLAIDSGQRLWLAGRDDVPAAYVDAALFGTENHLGYPEFSTAVARAFADVAGIDARNVFVQLSEIGAFSAGPAFFDRGLFT